MTGSNHIITGALVATVVTQPVVAIPLAFLSHFVLDALPHYGHEHDDRYWLTSGYTRVLVVDMLIILTTIFAIWHFRPENWGLMIICGIAAVLPDALWVPYYLHDRKNPEPKQRGKLGDILKRIQTAERPWGIYVEAAWLVVFGGLLVTVLR